MPRATRPMTKSSTNSMMIHRSTSPHEHNGYAEQRKKRPEDGSSMSKQQQRVVGRDSGNQHRGSRGTVQSRQVTPKPSEEDIRRRNLRKERERAAQQKTVDYLQSSTDLKGVSMHVVKTEYDEPTRSSKRHPRGDADASEQKRIERAMQRGQAAASRSVDAAEEQREKERAIQRFQASVSRSSTNDPRTSDSALLRRLKKDDREKQQRYREDGSNDHWTSASGDSGDTGARSTRSRDSGHSRGSRSSSVPRNIHGEPSNRQRMQRRGSLGSRSKPSTASHQSSKTPGQQRRSTTPGKTRSSTRPSSTVNPRRSMDHTTTTTTSTRQPRSRGDHQDQRRSPPTERQLGRINEFTKQQRGNDKRRAKPQPRSSNNVSQRSRRPDPHRSMPQPRRTVSETDTLERHRRRGSGGSSEKGSHSRSPRSSDPNGNERSSRQPRRVARRRSIGSVRRGVPEDESRSSSNAFAEAMKAMLLDGSVSGYSTEKEMEQRIAEVVFSKLRGSTNGNSHSSDSNLQAADSANANDGPPENMATIVLTDVQGSTSLWEANPQAMQEALDIHDKILRRFCAFHNGYEIDTEGDAFFLAFHRPMDAFGFALATQSALYDTEWSKELLAIPAAAKDGYFSGLRVRMGIHYGPVTSCKNAVTGRTEYVGEAWNIAKCVEGMTHGGQILTTFETWNVASYKSEADLGSPQVVDLGCHKLKPKCDEPVEARIIQLVPASLSFDYFASRRVADDNSPRPTSPIAQGRLFDAPITEEQVSASFHDAPHKNNEVTIAFVYFSEIEIQYEDPKPIIAALIRLIGDLLNGTPGYHSQSNMLAFPNVNEAVKFGLRLMEELKETRLTDDFEDLSTMIKFGCVHDTFLTMGPHKTTGRADYFGKVVNRAARITAKSDLGTVCFGVLADACIDKLPDLDRSISSQLKGVKQLKGVQEEMALYQCELNNHGGMLGLK